MDARAHAATARENAFQTIATHIPVALFVATSDGECEWVNERWCALTGLTPEQALGLGWQSAIHPDDTEQVSRGWIEACGAGREVNGEVRLQRPDGTVAWVETCASPLRDGHGHLIGWICTGIDRTSRRAAAEQAARFRTAFDNAPIGMGLLGLDGRWLDVNPALCNLLEYSHDALLELPFDALRLPDARTFDIGELLTPRPETRYRRSDGSSVWVAVSTTLVRDEQRRPAYYVVQLEDISERKRAEHELRRLATQDELTDLLNRRGFLAGLARELRRMRRSREFGALLVVDLDNFKQVNDSAGHAEGDRVLRETADGLRRRLRATDIVGRLGGDEFAALLLDVDESHARQIAFELTQTLRARVQFPDGSTHEVRPSIGLVAFDGADEHSDETLLADADHAMYEVKLLNRAVELPH